MTVDDLLNSATNEDQPPDGLSDEAKALWHTKAGNWDAAHDIASAIHTPMGSWIHALLHLIEGDIGNAGYWYRKADKPPRTTNEIDEHWREIATEVLR